MKQKSPAIKWYQLASKPGKIFVLSLLFFLLAIAKMGFDVFSPNVIGTENKYITIRSNQGMEKLMYELEYGTYLKNFVSFKRLASLVQLNEKLKPGRYLLKPGMNNFELIKLLVQGRQIPLDIVFKSAERIENVCGFFGRKLEPDSLSLLDMLKDTAIIHPLGFDTNTIISLFVPNTYNFYWNTNRLAFLNRMQEEYTKFWTAERLGKLIHLQMTKTQVSTLASIVQKESNKKDEMPVIAGVYLNRLKMGMPLQADPTVIFAWNDNNIRRVTGVHTALESPYNTYLNVGLPPGPICAPTIQAIDAVLNYEQHNYLYFCAREDFSGYHAFAANFNQHQENARRYQRALNARQIH